MMKLTRILVATDFGEASDAALNYGRELARMFSAQLDILHVADNVLTRGFGAEGYVANYPELQRDVEEAARRNLDAAVSGEDRATLRARPVVITSNTPAMAIVSYARDADVDLI